MNSTAAIRNTKIFDESHKNVMIPTHNFAKFCDDFDKSISVINKGSSWTMIYGENIAVSEFKSRTGGC